MMDKYVILTPENLMEEEKFAVEEALFFIPQITRKTAEISKVLPTKNDTYCISLGRTEAFEEYCKKTDYVLSKHRSDDGFDVCVDGSVCYIVGQTETGTLFGLYETLKRMFGFQLYSEKDFSYESETIKGNFGSFVFEPSIPLRGVGVYPVFSEDQNMKYMLRMKLSAAYGRKWVMWGHTFHQILPNEKYMESHPEWYGTGNNAFNRQYNKNTEVSEADDEITKAVREGMSEAKSLCLTNDEVKAEFTKNLIKILEEKPNRKWVMLGQEDNQCVCMCEKCEALRAKYNYIESAVVLTFMNDVVKQVNAWVAQNQPERELKFATFAYMYTLFPPVKKTEKGFEPLSKDFQLEDNLYIMIAPNGANSSDSYFSEKSTICFDDCYSGPHHSRILDVWEGWHAITKNTMVWTYNADYVDFLAPFLCWDAFEMNFKGYAAYGAEYVFEEGVYPYPIPNFTELKIYCAAEMMWDCNRELRSLIEEFIFHYYDDKTGCVQKYFDYLNGHREYLEKNFNRKMIPGLYADYEVLSSGLYWSKEFLEEALSIMDNDAAIPEDYNSLTEYEWRRLGERLPCEYILLKNYLDELPKEIAKKKVDFVERIAAHIGGINRIGEFAPKDLPTYISEWKEKL